MREEDPVTVTLGAFQERVEARVRSGAYESVSDVVQAGLRALDREEAERDDVLRRSVRAAVDDGRPAIPADDIFAALRAHHAERVRAAGHDV